MGMGGTLMTMPSGIINAILNNVGAWAISCLVPLIRFHSATTESHFMVITIFIVTYFNMGLLCIFSSGEQFNYLPNAMTDYWLLFWGKAITTSLIVSNLMPYANPVIKVFFRRGLFCCKRKYYQPNTHLNPEFSIERRYASVLNTIFIVFTFSFALPILPIVAAIVFLFQYLMDKLLITYYYKEKTVNDDLLNTNVLRIIKYGIILFFLSGASILAANSCAIHNKT